MVSIYTHTDNCILVFLSSYIATLLGFITFFLFLTENIAQCYKTVKIILKKIIICFCQIILFS